MTARSKPKPAGKKRGPKTERLALSGDWEEAVKKALAKPKPDDTPKKKGRGK